mgnify:CR=1 FL=1
MPIPGDEFLTTQSTGIWIVPSMTLHMSLYVVPGDETLATQSTVIWILPRMIPVIAEFEFTATNSTMVCYLSDMNYWVSCLLIPGAGAGKQWYRLSPV